QVRVEAPGRNPVDMLQQFQRFDQRQIPPELGTLAKDDADPRGQFATLPPGNQSGNRDLTTTWHKNASQHLDRRALAGTVRADVSNDLPRSDRKRNPVYRSHRGTLTGHQIPEYAAGSSMMPAYPV